MSDYYETLAKLIRWEYYYYIIGQTIYNGWRLTRGIDHYTAVHPKYWVLAIESENNNAFNFKEANLYYIKHKKLPDLLEEIDKRVDTLSAS